MALIPYENLGSGGIVLDKASYELPPEIWSAGKNVRFKNNRVEKFPGHEQVTGTPSTPPRFLLPWPGPSDYYWIYAGTDEIYRVTGTTHGNITRYTTTPGDDDYNATVANRWSGGLLGGVPILNHDGRNDYPQQWDIVNSRLKDLDNWQADYYCSVMRVHKQFLVALRVTKSTGTSYEHLVKWSHPATPGTVPASWDETDDAYDTGEVELAETGGLLVDCMTLGGVNIVYKEGSTYTMQYVGGQSIFAFDRIYSNFGLLAVGCMQEFDGKHFAVGRDDIVVHDGTKNGIQSIISGRNLDWFRENLSADYYPRTFVLRNLKEREMWVCLVTEGGAGGIDAFTVPDTAMVWNWDSNTWSFRSLPGIAHAEYGVVDDSTSGRIIDSQTMTIDSDDSLIDARTYSPAKESPLLAGTDDTKLFKADSTFTFDGSNVEFSIERTGLAIAGKDRQGNIKIDLNSRKFVRRIFPKIVSASAVDIYVGNQENEEGAVAWSDAYSFTPGTDKFIDVLLNFRFLCLKVVVTSGVSCVIRGFLLDMDLISESTL